MTENDHRREPGSRISVVWRRWFRRIGSSTIKEIERSQVDDNIQVQSE